MMKGGYFLRITLVVFQIEKFSEADSFQTLSPPPVSKQIFELNPPLQKSPSGPGGAGLNNRSVKI